MRSLPEEIGLARPSRDRTFMTMAYVLKDRSTCERGQVGCVVVSPSGFVLSTGYNGAPSGMWHCFDVGCLIHDGHCVRSVHAEMNSILTAGRNGVSLEGAVVYSTTRPCIRCSLALIQAGVRRVVWSQLYHGDDVQVAADLFREAGVIFERVKP